MGHNKNFHLFQFSLDCLFLIGIHSMQAEQPLQGMESQEKKAQKD